MQIAEELGALLGVPLSLNRENQSVKCPMHDDRVASMSISLPKGVWFCWGCDKGGTLTTLARFLGGDIDRTDLLLSTINTEPDPEPVDFTGKYNEFLPINPLTAEAVTYRKEKGIAYETLDYFGIRHDSRGTLVMPYVVDDRVVALRYRTSDGRKWYESGSERTIYNLNAVRGASRIVLCEGESDTHAVHSALRDTDVVVGGIPGANSSREKWQLWQLDMMWAEEIYIAFDADEAGDKGAERGVEILGPSAKRLRPTTAVDWSDALKQGEQIGLSG